MVPSDVVAGLVLLRKYQKLNRQDIVKSNKNEVYEFLSGVPITPRLVLVCVCVWRVFSCLFVLCCPFDFRVFFIFIYLFLF